MKSFPMLNQEQHCETLQRNGDIASHILKLEVNAKLHAHKCFAAGVRETGAYWLVSWVDLTAFLVNSEKSSCSSHLSEN
jgi:hypothetical protein